MIRNIKRWWAIVKFENALENTNRWSLSILGEKELHDNKTNMFFVLKDNKWVMQGQTLLPDIIEVGVHSLYQRVNSIRIKRDKKAIAMFIADRLIDIYEGEKQL